MDNATLRNFIRHDQLEAFFGAVSKISFDNSDQVDEIVLLEARYKKLRNSVNRNEISTEFAEQEHNRIRSACLEFIANLELPETSITTDQAVPLSPRPAPPPSRPVDFKKGLFIFGGIAIVAVLVWILGFSQRPLKTDQASVVPQKDSLVADNPNAVEKPTNPAPQISDPDKKSVVKKQGNLLKVSGNHAASSADVENFISEILLKQGIETYTSAKSKSYASAIDCRFSVDKTPTNAGVREDAFKLVVVLNLGIRNSDNVLCFTRRFTSEAQIFYPEDNENAMVQSALESLRQAITRENIKPCPN